ncbi:hypothetical protein [Aeoliella sp. SH292]|jgi:hypothetical protein|uniref:hypothetical protein n=1 Tax=Aeoliella sp. SH292 TaxID=3454464 RepID=UPI003F9AD62E
MDCDQVFMVLTSGPFPTGDRSDVAVEEHLECCASCWRIAEALRPAHDLFEEAVPASESRDLPGYWGDAVPARLAMADVQQTALRTAALARRARPLAQPVPLAPLPSPTTNWSRIAAVAALVLSFSSLAAVLTWIFV